MASLSAEAPDPKTFKSWEDAFKYPVPAVRRLQQQLKGDISGNRERLRTLVGGSYRDLLNTADSIIEMDKQMQEVEVLLGNTSRKCNTSLLEKSFANASKLDVQAKTVERGHFVGASQLSVLRKCPEVLVRILRKGGSVMLAAKVLIISRLLHKKLATDPRAVDYVDAIWNRLGKLRQKLLATIDRRLASSVLETAGLIDALCAYSLATSTSSSLDILRHFHRVRLDALSVKSGKETQDHTQVENALKIWIRTLQDTRSIFPKQLAAALAKLRSAPILEDRDVQSITAFDFEIHQAWLGDDVQNFIPYFRRDGRDDLQITEASKQLASWAPSALKTLFLQLRLFLSSIEDLNEIIIARKACLELLFSHYHVPGARKNAVLNGFREAFENRLLTLVSARCQALSGVHGDIVEILDDWDSYSSQENSPTMWDSSTAKMNISHGGKIFTNTVRDILNGRTNATRLVADHYHTWSSKIEEIEKVIAGMKVTKWEDYLDELSSDDDSDSESEETTLSRIKILLKEQDPAKLQESLSGQLFSSFQAFQSAIDSIASSLTDDLLAQEKSVFLLRALRDIKLKVPHAYTGAAIRFTSVPMLQSTISLPAIDTIVTKQRKYILKALRQSSPPGRGLWDGTPELPVLPSPWTFRLLKNLEQELSTVGTDVWTPSAKGEMKKVLKERLVKAYQVGKETCNTVLAPNGHIPNIETEGKHSPEDEKESNSAEGDDGSPSKDSAIQHLFDVEFLDASSEGEVSSPQNEALDEYRSWLAEKADLPPDLLKRISASATEYKKRTALLFALVN